MTGRSDFSKPCLIYYKKLISGLLIVGGGFLMIEHLFSFGGFDIEIVGHEWYGLGMIILGFLLSMKWRQIKDVIKAIKDRDIRKIIDEGERKR